MSLFANRRGSLGSESSCTTTLTSQPVPLPRSSIMTGLRGRDDSARMTQDMGSSNAESSTPSLGNGTVGSRSNSAKVMVDSHFPSFNAVGIGSPRVEDYEDEDFDNDVNSDPFRPHKKGPAPPIPGSGTTRTQPIHPGTIPSKNKPALQRLEELPGLSIVTWEEFVENPSVLCGLFETDRNDFIHYNAEQVNVFFHDSRMEQPTLGAPSWDGLSWTIFIDNYNHLRAVRSWLIERVSVILVQLIKPNGQGKAACLVAINPLNKSVGADLHNTFTKAVETFLHQRNFSVELNLNTCVQRWCCTVLQMTCTVIGGRLVVTNGDEYVPCSRVYNVPFCVLCFPVWGIQKLCYRFKRRSDYDDFFLYFHAEDLALCTRSPKLKEYAEKNNNNPVNSRDQAKPRTWIKRNRKSATASTQTLDTEDADNDRADLTVEEVEDVEDSTWLSRTVPKDRGRGKDSVASTASSPENRLEPQPCNGLPSYRPHRPVAPGNPKEKPQRSESKNNLLSESMTSATSSLNNSIIFPGGEPAATTRSAVDPTPREGALAEPMAPASWRGGLQCVEEDDDSLNLPTPRTPRSPREDLRAQGFGPMSTMPCVGSDDEHGNSYRLTAETPSPRPATPYNARLSTPSLKTRMRGTGMMSQEFAVAENAAVATDQQEDVVQLKGGTADVPAEPGTKQKKKRISKVLRDLAGSTQQQVLVNNDELNLRRGEGGLYARDNQAFVREDSNPDESPSSTPSGAAIPFKNLKTIDKVKYTSIKDLKDKKQVGQKAFPYTSELLDFVGENTKGKTSYTLADPSGSRGEEVKLKPRKKSAVQKKAEDMLFAPRFKLGEDRQDRNCLSDNDIANDEDDLADLEPDSVMSDVEGVASPRLIPVKKTTRTVAVDSIQPPRSDTDTDWEITDCELDDGEAKTADGPRVLQGARGAQQLRAASAQRAKELPASVTAEARRRGGTQNDSRRRYIALNSLRRKANQLALQAELRKQKRPDSSSSARMEIMDC